MLNPEANAEARDVARRLAAKNDRESRQAIRAETPTVIRKFEQSLRLRAASYEGHDTWVQEELLRIADDLRATVFIMEEGDRGRSAA